MITYYLSQNRHIWSQLQKIIRKYFKKPEDITYSKLKDMNYLDWCLLQTSRMYGPGTGILTRQAQKDVYIDNIPIMRDTGIRIQLLASHYNAKFYQDPLKFDPVRWQTKEPSPFTFGNFGFGPQACLGKSLALLMAKITVTLLAIKFDRIELAPDSQISLIYRGTYQPTSFKTVLWHPIDRETEEPG